MEIMKTLLALVGGVAIGTGATVGIVTLVNKHRSGKPTLILGKESCPACMEGLTLEKDIMRTFSNVFKDEIACGNVTDSPESLSSSCKLYIKEYDRTFENKALESSDLNSNLKEILPTLSKLRYTGLDRVTVKQNVNGEFRVLTPRDILEFDTSDVSSMSDIHIFYTYFYQPKQELEAVKCLELGTREPLSNSEKALAIRYLQAKFINKVINL